MSLIHCSSKVQNGFEIERYVERTIAQHNYTAVTTYARVVSVKTRVLNHFLKHRISEAITTVIEEMLTVVWRELEYQLLYSGK